MNGLSPQATFKPSPNPRYQNMGGRGRGHRRNMSHNNSSNADSSSTPTNSNQQSSTGGFRIGFDPAPLDFIDDDFFFFLFYVSSEGSATGNNGSNVNGKSSTSNSVNVPVGNGPSSFNSTKGIAATSNPQSTNSHSSGSSRDKEGFNSTSQHQVQKSTSEGVSAVGGYPNEDRRPQEANNDRGMGNFSFLSDWIHSK